MSGVGDNDDDGAGGGGEPDPFLFDMDDVDNALTPDAAGDDVGGVASDEEQLREAFDELFGRAPRPVNWRALGPVDAEQEWLELNAWVDWLRFTYGLPATIVPPLWHRHPELVWELSALHTAWLSAYDLQQAAGAPLTWHRDFQMARERLREWVALSGSRLDRDRPTRQTAWPGEGEEAVVAEQAIVDRDADFVAFVWEDTRQREAEERARRGAE